MDAPSYLLVGVDASSESLAALELALRLAVAVRCRLGVVHAVGLLEEGGFRERPGLSSIVERACEDVENADPTLVDIISEDGPAADVIVRVAERRHADLIVVGSRGMGQAPRMLGSVSEAVLAHAHVPVLIVPRP